ncbi:hypothetical protein HOY82DRAFT_547486 [Tuber indicum]|nr:hypothetical protein HOY82DRAFT_547486 [Tuber indicum]
MEEESEELDSSDTSDSSREPVVPAEDPGAEEAHEETHPVDSSDDDEEADDEEAVDSSDDGNDDKEAVDSNKGDEEAVDLGEPPDVDAARSGVSIPNTARGKAFRRAFVRLEGEIESARARRRPRGRPNHVYSCGLRIRGWGSDPDVRLHNNLNWRTNEIPPPSTGLLSFLPNFDRRIIVVGYIFLCIASDYGLRKIWPTFTSAYSSILTATIMVLGLFSVKIPDSLTARSNNPS